MRRHLIDSPAAALATVLLASCALVAPPAARAQGRSPVTLDATVGFGVGVGGHEYRDRTGYSGDALLGVRVAEWGRGNLVVGASAGAQGPPGGGDDCLLTPTGGCIARFPIFYVVGLAAGWEQADGRLRLLAGPVAVQGDGGARTGGLQLRSEAALGIGGGLSVVFSVRGVLVPRYAREAMGLLGFGLGVRAG